MIFASRKQAGQKLASLLSAYKHQKDTWVVGLARGGVVVASEIAKALHLPLNLATARKITSPMNPELALGAVSEEGEILLNEELIEAVGLSKLEMQEAIQKAKQEVLQKSSFYRRLVPKEDFEGKTLILVDDGAATGFTMLAELKSLKRKKVKKLIAAVPVSSSKAWEAIENAADEAVCLEVRDDFSGISEFYSDFAQVEDDEVASLLKHSRGH